MINTYSFKLIFTYKQLAVSVQTIALLFLFLYIVTVIDLDVMTYVTIKDSELSQ